MSDIYCNQGERMKNLIGLVLVSMSLVACGGGSGGSGGTGGSGGSGGDSAPVDQRIGIYSAEIKDSGGVITRSLDLHVEADDAVTSGVPEDVPFIQLRDGDNMFSRYRYMRNTVGSANNHFATSDYESESAHYTHGNYDSLQDCLDGVSGTGAVYEKIVISNPKFSGGGSLSSLSACKVLD